MFILQTSEYMTKIKKCHIERSRNAFENDIPNVFDCAQTDIRYIINFCHVLISNLLVEGSYLKSEDSLITNSASKIILFRVCSMVFFLV